MKTQHIYIVLVALFSIGISSCTEGSFEKIVEVEFEDVDREMVTLAQFSQQDSNHFSLVSHTLGQNESGAHPYLTEGKVQLTTPDQGIIDFHFNAQSRLFKLENYSFLEKENYTLYVEHPEFPSMTAEAYVPASPEIVSASLEFEEEEFGGNRHIIKVRFKDPVDEKNFYKVRAFHTWFNENDSTEHESEYWFTSSSVNIFNSNDDIISDETFNGTEHELMFSSSEHFKLEHLVSARLEFYSYTEDEVLYDRSIQLARNSDNNPFVEPSIIYSNFDNGFGMFTISNKTEIFLEF